VDHYDVFPSSSRNKLDAATNLRRQLERGGLAVFHDQKNNEGDLWLTRLQDAVEACGSFVVLVGRNGVRRWIGAETQVALSRYFGPHDDESRLPIFPILLGPTGPSSGCSRARHGTGPTPCPRACSTRSVRAPATGGPAAK
jgi:hypothetical protein